ncbi:adenine specific DNA methylase Mod [Candidatus Poribacteria bacterium]|nr:adenine specific DNA methylase Mod [Candidatus Poribacteria bacterium]
MIEFVSFRNLVPEITETGYLTHAIVSYPAKFIPQVVRYALNTYTKENDWVIDPFAGSGTVGVEAYLCKRNAFLLDLNLLLNHLMPMKVFQSNDLLRKEHLHILLEEMQTENKHHFMPAWSNIEYWYAPEILKLLSQYWGYIYNIEDNIYTGIIKTALLKVSKRFSYTEHRTPKLARSKRKLAAIDELLQENWVEQLLQVVYDHSLSTLKKLNDFLTLTQSHENRVEYYGGVDSSNFTVQRKFDALITSPPYLQAQEYIRSTKMDLYWLGHNDDEIKQLSRLEIPYRKADRVTHTPTLDVVRSKLTRKDLCHRLESYFCHTLNALENSMNQLKPNGVASIFVGNPRIDGIEVELWKIISEYFTERGFTFKKVYEDRIKTRQLFGTRKNKNPEGMKSEFLLILKKE